MEGNPGLADAASGAARVGAALSAHATSNPADKSAIGNRNAVYIFLSTPQPLQTTRNPCRSCLRAEPKRTTTRVRIPTTRSGTPRTTFPT